MKVLNLANEGDEASEIKTDIRFKLKKFPDGQTDIIINPEDVDRNVPVQITSHFNSWEDMVKIICARVALNKLKVKEIHLYIPYILGARSDRRFEKGGTSYLVDVVAPTLNLQNFESVTCVDAHSDVAQGCINRLEVVPNYELVKWAIEQIGTTNFRIAAPDQGATKKVFELVHELKIESPILFCVKHRDQKTGKILHTEVPITDKVRSVDYIVVDDICDGGRTFIEIAKEIKRLYTPSHILEIQNEIQKIKEEKNVLLRKQDYESAAKMRDKENQLTNELILQEKLVNDLPIIRIFLVVTHGIFSNHFSELNKWLDGMYTTNSISCYGWDVPPLHPQAKNLNVMDVIHYKIETNK